MHASFARLVSIVSETQPRIFGCWCLTAGYGHRGTTTLTWPVPCRMRTWYVHEGWLLGLLGLLSFSPSVLPFSSCSKGVCGGCIKVGVKASIFHSLLIDAHISRDIILFLRCPVRTKHLSLCRGYVSVTSVRCLSILSFCPRSLPFFLLFLLFLLSSFSSSFCYCCCWCFVFSWLLSLTHPILHLSFPPSILSSSSLSRTGSKPSSRPRRREGRRLS